MELQKDIVFSWLVFEVSIWGSAPVGPLSPGRASESGQRAPELVFAFINCRHTASFLC